MLICMPIKTLLLYLAATHSLGTKVIFHYSLGKAKPTISCLDSASFSNESPVSKLSKLKLSTQMWAGT